MWCFEDFSPGQNFALGTYTVSADDIIGFGTQWDPQRFHVNCDEAARTPFAGLIASGWHTASIFMHLYVKTLLADSSGVGSPGVDELRWREPVRPDDTLTASLSVERVVPSPISRDRGTVHPRCTLTNQHGRTVFSMVLQSIFLTRSAVSAVTERG